MFKERLLTEELVVYKTLYNALEDNKLAHAYLFVGSKGTPKKETALLLAKSMICPTNDVFACEVCPDCERVETGNFADLLYIEPIKKTIKKEVIVDLRNHFNKTGLERHNKKIYIIDGLEYAPKEAQNSLLSLLEEPMGQSTYGIILTESLDRVLETIISRCQIVNFKPITFIICFKYCLDKNYDYCDSYVLSNLVRDISSIDKLIDDPIFQCAIGIVMTYIDKLLKDPYLALMYLQIDAFRDKKDETKEILIWVIDILILFFNSTMISNYEKEDKFRNYQRLVSSRNIDINSIVVVLLQSKDKLYTNTNIQLLIDQIGYKLKENINE